jgi:hypothetical protein
VSIVVSCPNCEKRLAVKDELKGRSLMCPKCNGRFTVPLNDVPGDIVPVAGELATGNGSMGFLDDLGLASAGPATSTAGGTSATAYSPRAVGGQSARAAEQSKRQADQMKMIYVGGGIAAAVLIVVALAIALNGIGGRGEKAKEAEDTRFGLTERTRIELFQKLVSAVDRDGISKSCKEDWFRLADEYKLDRSHIKDLLDEGFSYKNSKWELPEAVSTAKNKALRQDWVRQRTTNGTDPVLAL